MKVLNLIPLKMTVGKNSIPEIRESLMKGIDKQIMIYESSLEGKDILRDQHSCRMVFQWFWMDDSGSYYLSNIYGK